MLARNTTGNRNIATGVAALAENKTGSENVATGFDALQQASGSRNVAIGNFAGKELRTGSNNIEIANEGVTGESGTTRIGTEGKQTRAFAAGIYKKPVTTPACAVKVNSEGQLGCNGDESSTAIATFASFGGVPSGNCLNFGDPSAQGQGACTGAPPGWSKERTLAGPIPDNGAVVSYLHAETEKALSGTDSATVEVIDNDVVLLACSVHAPSASCTAGVGGAANPGDNLEVRINKAVGPSGNKKPWRVSFRY